MSDRFDVTLNGSDVPLDRDALASAMVEYDAVCCTITDRFDGELLDTPGSTVRILANFGAGIEHIDLPAAERNAVVVTNTPDALTEATAEIAITLMLMAARRTGEGERELRAGGWTGWRPTHLVGRGLTGKTLGLIGFGRIAQATSVKAVGLGMNVVYHSRRPKTVQGARFVASIVDLVMQADVVSLHVPGGLETHHLVDSAMIKRMKAGAILVNTARGSVIDEGALAAALSEGRIAAAGLDVFENEPNVHPDLLSCQNVVLLPHLGSATIEARTAMGMQAAHNLDEFFDDRDPPNRVG